MHGTLLYEVHDISAARKVDDRGVMQISSEPWLLIVVNEAQNRG